MTFLSRTVAVSIFTVAELSSCAAHEKTVELLVPVVAKQPEDIDDVASYLQKNLPNVRLVNQNDYENERLGMFSGFDTRWMVEGDFDGNRIHDIAALTVDESRTVSLLAFHRFDRGIRHFVLEQDLGQLPVYHTLKIQPAGWTSVSEGGVEELTIKKLKNPGVVRDLFETCDTTLNYWENGKYHSVYRGI